MLTVDMIAHFTWSFGHTFHLETEVGNFEWSDPDYGGDNTIKPCGTLGEWCKKVGIDFGRDKGKHFIRDYCGPDVRIQQ